MVDELIFVGFHSQVVALDRRTGTIVWQWKSHDGKGYVSLLLDGDRLIASVMGYTHCLDAATGKELWFNALKGLGVGVASLASARADMGAFLIQAAAEEAQREQDAASAPATM